MTSKFFRNLGILFVMIFSYGGQAAVMQQNVSYKDGKDELQGIFFFDDTWAQPRPLVMVVHQWMGISDHEKAVADRLAHSGYAVFLMDIYGKNQQPQNTEEAAKISSTFKNNPQRLLSRQRAALKAAKNLKKADSSRIVFSGYCFGGTAILEAARAQFPLLGAVSFHGGLKSALTTEKSAPLAKILVLQGALDPAVPWKDVDGFIQEMNAKKADYQFIAYSGAVHSFTVKTAGGDISKGSAYNEVADHRSWIAFMDFLDEVIPVVK